MPASKSDDRRIIEEQMPLTAISAHSAREKSIRHGHLSTLHIWWARRPLAACRAAIFAALVPQPDDPKETKKIQAFIANLANCLSLAQINGNMCRGEQPRECRHEP